ncbi:MAG: serine hydroxymethyltransferase [Chloroflexi bacterium]|nr:serine hydroxymethyltransferase [Chloroflexota bacterium]
MQEQVIHQTGFLFEGAWEDIDPESIRITAFEEARQVNKLIMIASESVAPPAVRQALGSVFTDLYAEGYPSARLTHEASELITDIPYQLAYFHRYGDRRYYKGTEFADLIEALAQRRVRELFAPNRYPHNPSQLGPEDIQANVQPWSGANANTAVYLALLQPGDTIMGMNLSHGGHLSHGSPVNISGRIFRVVPYGVNPETGRIDYDEVERLAREHNPRLIVCGASAYPWDIDFVRLRQICDNLPRRAYLMADISHPAGLVAAGLFPNPVGVADVVTFTTHKTLIGPRAAVILTTNEALARRIDRAVFPGLQGGPHVNTIAALAVAFKIAQTPAFQELQRTIVANARALADALSRRGLKIAYGGTSTHLLLVDLKAIPKRSGIPLNGDIAARILDLCGIVCNKNTILGDTSAAYPSGIRLGTPWLTQRGLTPTDMDTLGNIIADVLFGIETFAYPDRDEVAARGKIPLITLQRARAAVADLIKRRTVGPSTPDGWPDRYCPAPQELDGQHLIAVIGRRARQFLSEVCAGEIWSLEVGGAARARLFDAVGQELGEITVLYRSRDSYGRDHFVCAIPAGRSDAIIEWLEALSSGLVLFDPADPWAKIDGPVAIAMFADQLSDAETAVLRRAMSGPSAVPRLDQPYFIGQRALSDRMGGGPMRPLCALPTPGSPPPSPIASRYPAGEPIAPEGWGMPLSFGDPTAEFAALHSAVGLVDESALGIIEISGPDAARFLDLVTTNNVMFLAVNAAQYTFLLTPTGELIADGLLYRMETDRYRLTVAPTRTAAVMHWLGEALAGHCAVDTAVPTRGLPTRLTLRDARSGGDGTGQVILGLAGPGAPAVLRAAADTAEDRRRVGGLRRFTLTTARLAGIGVVIARTGHTGASHGYEIFVRADRAGELWDRLLERGAAHGIRPVGWRAYRAAGIAAGLPWTGRELGGTFAISPVAAGYGALVRLHKPFFVGRSAITGMPIPPDLRVVRFTVTAPVTALPRDGDPLLDPDGRCVGHVTSGPELEESPIGFAWAEARATPVGAGLSVLVGAGNAPRSTIGERLDLGETLYPIATVEILPRFPR